MRSVTIDDLKNLYLPPPDSHKGQNGKLLVIGGSHLFHAASLWALTVASRIVDLVHYSSVPENNEIVMKLKEEFRDGIVVRREDVESYIEEDDTTLIGPGMVRVGNSNVKTQNSKPHLKNQPIRLPGLKTGVCSGLILSGAFHSGLKSGVWRRRMYQNLQEILQIQDEGQLTGALTNYLLYKYPNKQWVIDAGALQMVDPKVIPAHSILTPHKGEFEILWQKLSAISLQQSAKTIDDRVKLFAKIHQCTVLLKGEKDIACDGITGETCVIEGGNAGMTKGGTGDVLAGLIAALACKNDPFPATMAGSFINKKAGDELYDKVGPYFNASDLANQIPLTMKSLLL